MKKFNIQLILLSMLLSFTLVGCSDSKKTKGSNGSNTGNQRVGREVINIDRVEQGLDEENTVVIYNQEDEIVQELSLSELGIDFVKTDNGVQVEMNEYSRSVNRTLGLLADDLDRLRMIEALLDNVTDSDSEIKSAAIRASQSIANRIVLLETLSNSDEVQRIDYD